MRNPNPVCLQCGGTKPKVRGRKYCDTCRDECQKKVTQDSRERTARWQKSKRGRQWTSTWHKARRKAERPLCRRCGLTSIAYPGSGRKYCDGCQAPAKKSIGQKQRAKRLKRLREYKVKRGCDQCGYSISGAALDFHHRDPTVKKHRVWIPTSKEAKKCDLLCANCHREKHNPEEII